MHLRRICTALLALALIAVVGCTRDAAPATEYGAWIFLDPDAARSNLPAVVPDGVEPRDNDRPINPQLIARIARTGADVRYASRWLRAVSVNATHAELKQLRRMRDVVAIRPIADAYPLGSVSPAAWLAAALADSAFYGQAFAPLRELNIPVLHTLGFTGLNQRIAIFDTGFELHDVFRGLPTRIGAQRDFINDDNDVFDDTGVAGVDQKRHGTAVWSLLGGYRPNVFVSGAYDATFYLAKVDSAGSLADTRGDEDRWVEAMEWAFEHGVRFVNSSIGFRYEFVNGDTIPYGDLDGNTTVTTVVADEAAQRGMLVVVAIGDGRPQSGSLVAPADADSVLVVGAIDSVRPDGGFFPSQFSNRGPSGNGGTRPDVVARGENLVLASSDAQAYVRGPAGSSYAAPLITAGAALYSQAWPEDGPIAIRQALRLSATHAFSPNSERGWGLPDIAAAVMMPDGLQAGLVSSMDPQRRLTTVRPTFSWFAQRVHTTMRPLRYRLEIASDSAFADLVYIDSIAGAEQLMTTRPLRPMPRAFWRVTAISPLGVRRTTPPQPRFSIPSWVTLLTLAGPENEFINERRPLLAWSPLANPARFTYDVQIIGQSGQVVQTMNDLQTSTVRPNTDLSENQSYRWRVIARSGLFADTVESTAPFVIISDDAPPATLLHPPFPNPVLLGDRLGVWFDLSSAGEPVAVQLSVHDSRGGFVRNLIPARSGCGAVHLPPGLYGRDPNALGSIVADGCATSTWDGLDVRGRQAPPGIYILRLRAGRTESIQRFVVIP